MIRQEIKNSITKAIKELQDLKKLPGFEIPEIKLERPEVKEFGDYSTNVAKIIASKIKKDPIEIAGLISQRFYNPNVELYYKTHSGFINFVFLEEYLQRQVSEILKQKEKFGELKIGKGQKIQVEFISANPTGPLTVGNARGGPFGDVLANVFKKADFKTEKAYYINDYGMQILALGRSVLKDSEAKYKGEYIDYLNKKIKEKDPYKVGEEAAKIIIEEMVRKTTDRMGIKYNEWFSESSLYKSNQVDKTLGFLKKEGLVYEKEGALWFKSSNFGDERDRVVVKADGSKTYLAGDIAYHRYKFEKKKFDEVFDIWGADHYGDIAGLQGAVEAFGHRGKLNIILLQFVTILEKGEKMKMSKRKGIFVTMDELLDKVGSDVVRFFFLQKSADTHLNFDISSAKEQSEKNPVFYVQYAHARICSILRKVKNLKFQASNSKLLNHSSELRLVKQLIRLPEIVEDTVKDYQVQRIPQYALDLATTFHQFYRDCRVISEKKELTRARLALVLATKIVLKNTLDLMGISAPEKM